MRVHDIAQLQIHVRDLETTLQFYHEVLDLPVLVANQHEICFQLGKQRLHCQLIDPQKLGPAHPTCGAAFFSILIKDSLTDLAAHLANYAIPIVKGPLTIKHGKQLQTALYINDPDGNLIEIDEQHPSNVYSERI
ncbi:biphenyl-2, 3-diol 1, 2-dioxygenase III-related protein [Fructilactobacillus florum 8D]|uniref:Biphenyl-2, 3-diol 1, 2-dioxygenase III-related protein n=1 Tax=Fructilactobacillus florum 8D TaxID=1221538 RepID=W9EF74_9LACO|nr:VOC family protein [Fructilactobacillus florum]EKK20601.1 biphenyl-2, 3-diol 1, 2-dioxygenase III-related protein [Fructilactobacillus florum 2F]ETO40793.1 biphenyl-2, 3-diol 1, 2-dioxygenase III-related protein [Fructilactobacillus florum 8D]